MADRRTIIIGDVHGCYRELVDLMRKLRATRRDRIVFVGDLVTKGPDSRRVLEYVERHPHWKVIMGNHEYLLAQHYRGEDVRLESIHTKVIRELGKDYDHHMRWICRWPSFMDLGDHLVVHAGIRPGVRLRQQTRRDLAFLRTLEGKPESRSGTPWFERYRGRRVVVFGHWVFRKPYITDKVVGLDTGCVYGGQLTALVLPAKRIVQVEARRSYTKKMAR